MTAPPHLDLISLRGITGFGHHGVFDFEKREGQNFVVDLDLGLDLQPAAVADDLDLTVNYGDLANRVHEAITSDALDLLESLALRIVKLCWDYGAVSWVKVTVHKPSAPIEVAFADVAVTIERSRQ